MSEQKRISLAPKHQTAGASFFDDVDVEIVGIEATLRDYTDKEKKVVLDAKGQPLTNMPTLVVKYRPLTDAGEQHEFEEPYSAGGKDRVTVADDGDGFVAVEGKDVSGTSDNARISAFFKALVAAGYPEGKLEDGRIKHLVGLRGHLLGVEPPKGGGKNKVKVIVKISQLPDGKSQNAGSEAEKKAAAFIIKALAQIGKPIAMTALSQAANKTFLGKPDQVAIVTKLLDAKFLKTQQGWVFDGKQVSAASDDSDAIVVE